MVSRAIVTTLTGIGSFVSASYLPHEGARVAARLAGLGIGAVGLSMLFDEIKDAGGLGGLSDELLGDLGESETREVVTVPNKVLVPAAPNGRPAQAERFVIPYSGSFVRLGAEVEHNRFRNSYPLTVRLQNFTTAPVTSSFVVDADEEALTSSEVVSFVHEPVTVRAGGELEITFDMPLSPGFFRLSLPYVQAKLTWPADFPYQPRGQDIAAFRVV